MPIPDINQNYYKVKTPSGYDVYNKNSNALINQESFQTAKLNIDLIPAGNVPVSPSLNQQIGTETQTTDFGASFNVATQDLQNLIQQIQKQKTDKTDISSQIYTTQQGQEQDIKDIAAEQKKAITTGFETSREALGTQFEKEKQSIEEVQAKIAPIASVSTSYFQTQNDLFDRYSKAIGQLSTEETTALQNADIQTASQLRQTRLDLLTNQAQSLNDTMAYTQNLYNLYMQGLQIAYNVQTNKQQADLQTQQTNQQNATNALNTITQSYGGKGMSFEKLPSDIQTSIIQNSATLGIPINAIKELIGSKTADIQFEKMGKNLVVLDKNTGKVVESYKGLYQSTDAEDDATKSSIEKKVAADISSQIEPYKDPKSGYFKNKIISPDGKVYSPYEFWNYLRSQWVKDGHLDKDFKKEFPINEYVDLTTAQDVPQQLLDEYGSKTYRYISFSKKQLADLSNTKLNISPDIASAILSQPTDIQSLELIKSHIANQDGSLLDDKQAKAVLRTLNNIKNNLYFSK